MKASRFLMFLFFFFCIVVTLAAVNPGIKSASNMSERQPLVLINKDTLLWSGQKEGEKVTLLQSEGPHVPYPFTRYSLEQGLNVTLNKLKGTVPLLPTLLPANIAYADVYIGPVVIIAWSSNAAADYRSSIIRVEITLNKRATPTDEQLNTTMLPGDELFRMSDTFGFIDEDARTGWGDSAVIASFYNGNLHYVMTASPPVTKQDLLNVIQSMKP